MSHTKKRLFKKINNISELSEYGLHKVVIPLNGDIVIYADDKGKILLAGIMLSNEHVLSRWEPTTVLIGHPLDHLPTCFGSTHLFFSKRTPKPANKSRISYLIPHGNRKSGLGYYSL